ncbi:hypothetical protein O181_061136 [Austropuccinia psidii MF-1]|uniref:Uncharacterized protein n=1 Tax=Austropuccinia psidii MF-1 TaxID=1389203 RepID=A0A9Q3EM71_9BASI|nr:hypothetical protein [Austropuccinia psidii MF-1]
MALQKEIIAPSWKRLAACSTPQIFQITTGWRLSTLPPSCAISFPHPQDIISVHILSGEAHHHESSASKHLDVVLSSPFQSITGNGNSHPQRKKASFWEPAQPLLVPSFLVREFRPEEEPSTRGLVVVDEIHSKQSEEHPQLPNEQVDVVDELHQLRNEEEVPQELPASDPPRQL